MWAQGSRSCIVLLVFSFLHLAISLPPALVDTKICKKSKGDFPKLGSFCRSFFRCINWIPVEMKCPLDQHFFPAKGYCVRPEEFPCLERPSSKMCPEPNGKFLKPGTRCREYYDCCDGKPSKKKCPGDTLFHSTSRKCDWPELVACPDDQDPGSKECPLANGNFLKPGSKCKYYYECNHFKPTKKKCWGDTIFDHTKGKCDWPELVDCVDDDGTTTDKDSSEEGESSEESKEYTTKNIISSTSVSTTDEDSSEEGESSEERKEYTTKHKIKSTYPTTFPVSNTIFEKTTTPSVFTEDLKETPSSTREKSTHSPVTSYKSSSTSTDAASTETKPISTTEQEVSTAFETSTSSSSRIDITTFPVALTDETSLKTTDDVNFKDKDSTTTTSSLTDVVTYHIFCPKPDGYFPHPSNKHQFIACVGGNPTIMNCPSNLVYDHKTKSCQYKRRIFF